MDAPIGVFDSGVGGLTVVKALTEVLPEEAIVYLGDTARVPYGNKSKKSIIEFSVQNVKFLLGEGVKLIVVACNTASATALEILKRSFDIPILGVIDAGVHKALAVSNSKSVGVIGTYRTIKTEAYARALLKADESIRVIQKACPLFVPFIEENLQEHEACTLIIKEYLAGLVDDVDALILGCTHYPLIKEQIARIYPNVRLVDSAVAVAEQVKSLLSAYGIHTTKSRANNRYYVTDMSENFLEIANRIFADTPIIIEERDI